MWVQVWHVCFSSITNAPLSVREIPGVAPKELDRLNGGTNIAIMGIDRSGEWYQLSSNGNNLAVRVYYGSVRLDPTCADGLKTVNN
jgi:hypothetical protein